MIRAMHFFQMNGRWIWIPWSSSWSRFSSDVLIQPFTIWARGRSLKTLQLSLSIYTTVTHIKTELWRRSEREKEFHFHTNQHAAKTYTHRDWYAIKSPKKWGKNPFSYSKWWWKNYASKENRVIPRSVTNKIYKLRVVMPQLRSYIWMSLAG